MSVPELTTRDAKAKKTAPEGSSKQDIALKIEPTLFLRIVAWWLVFQRCGW